jgi:hypothetical protein
MPSRRTTSQAQWIHHRPSASTQLGNLCSLTRDCLTSRCLEQACVVAEGDYVVQVGARQGRWHGGSFSGIDAPPGDYDRDFAAMYRLVEGQIAERWAIRDDLGMLRQLGAVVPSR